MLQAAFWREHLALEKRSFGEIATALSVMAIAGGMLYNIGFFAPIERSLISLLTVQDLLAGTAVALVPMAGAAGLLFVIGRWIRRAPEKPRLALLLGLSGLVVGAIGFRYFYQGPTPSTLGHLGSAYLALAGAAALINLLARSTVPSAVWIAFSLVYLPYSIGAATGVAALGDPNLAVSEVRTEKETVQGTIVRVTSAYVLLYDGRSVLTFPLNKVLSIKRSFKRSPGLEFLRGPE